MRAKKTRQKAVKAVSKKRAASGKKHGAARATGKKEAPLAARLSKAEKASVRMFVETPEWRDRMLKHIDAAFPHLVVLFVTMTHARDALKRNAKDWPNWVSQFSSDYVEFTQAFTTGMPDPRPPKMRK